MTPLGSPSSPEKPGIFAATQLITALGGPNRGVLLGCGEESRALYGLDHLLYGHDAFLIRHAGEFLFETHFCALDALQPFQGLLDHEGSGPSRHAVNPQVSDGGL